MHMYRSAWKCLNLWWIAVTLLAQADCCNITKSVDKTVFWPGERAQMSCVLHEGHSINSVDWTKRHDSYPVTIATASFRSGRPVVKSYLPISTSRMEVLASKNWTKLTIHNFTNADQGQYACRFHFVGGDKECIGLFSLTSITSTESERKHAEDGTSVDVLIYVLTATTVILLTVLFTVAAYHMYTHCMRRRKTEERHIQNQTDIELQPHDPLVANGAAIEANPHRVTRPSIAPDEDEITVEHLQFDRSSPLGEGQFGEVWKGYIESDDEIKTVAIKILKANVTEKEKQDFKTEMETLKNVPAHKNIVPLISTSSNEEPLFIVMEYQSMGSLQNVLRNGRGRAYYSNTYGTSRFTPSQLLTFGYEVASGMTHIADLGYLHRDLAARNVLVDENFTCKISDFGLARNVRSIREYESRSEGFLPLRWMALESIKDSVYTTHSDVWSFGILMWEIVTLGCTPYPGIASMTLPKHLESGYRMMRPKHCTQDVYNIMYRCWRVKPSNRPSFQDLCEQLQGLINGAKNYVDLAKIDEKLFKSSINCLPGEKY